MDDFDLYGDPELDFEDKLEDEPEQQGKRDEKMEEGDHESKMNEQAKRIEALKKELAEVKDNSQHWKAVCQKVAGTVGVDFTTVKADSEKLAEAVRQEKENAEKSKESCEVHRLNARKLQCKLYMKNVEVIELKAALHKARLSSNPAVIQLKQLLLDPALQKEFQLLKSAVESKSREVKRLQEELDGVNFTQESKAGKMLVAKCKKLQEENEDMGRELSEGRIHHLETQLSLARNFAEEMRKKCLDLEDHCRALDDEAEELQQQVFMLKGENPIPHSSTGPPPPHHSPVPHAARPPSPDFRDDGDRYDRKGRTRSGDRKRPAPPDRMPPERLTPERGALLNERPMPGRGPPVRGPDRPPPQPFARRRFK